MIHSPLYPTPLLSRVELAAQLGVSEHPLWRWRHDGVGPATVKIGKRVYYPIPASPAALAKETAHA